ncbi:MAG: M23 family metallopeptidase [Myxococcaceae bacterium]|nr:M23 family metallopeptidase [Myxococcaceae bacterium]
MRRWWLSLTAVAACASAPKETMTLEEALGSHRASAPAFTRTGSPALEAALMEFEGRVEAERLQATRGAAMGAGHQVLWATVLEAVEAHGLEASAFDCARARLLLERELEGDARVFGDLPEPLADRIQRARRALSARLASFQRAAPRLVRASWRWPLTPVEVTSRFGGRPHPIFGDWRMHSGIDLLAEPAQDVFTAAPGEVTFAGANGGHGNQVVVQHDAHLSTSYSHLEQILVRVGERLGSGARLGFAGETGRATGVHLHFELRRDGEAVDPEGELPSLVEAAAAQKTTGPEGLPPGPPGIPPVAHGRQGARKVP